MAIATGTAILGAAAIGLGGSAINSLIQSDAARDAAREQRKAIGRAQEDQTLAATQASELQQPFLDVGRESFMNLADIVRNQALEGVPDQNGVFEFPDKFEFGIEDIQSDPGVQFAQDQAMRAAEISSAGRGRGGGLLRELQRNAAGLASQQTNQAFQRKLLPFQQNFSNQLATRQQQLSEVQGNRAERQQQLQNLSQIAQLGPSTAANMGNLLTGQAANTAGLGIQLGNVNAAQRVAQAQALGQGIGAGTDFLNTILLTNAMGGNRQTQTPPPPLLPTGAGDLTGLNTGVG